MKIQKMFNVILTEREVKQAIHEYLERRKFHADCLTLMDKEPWLLDFTEGEFHMVINGLIDEEIK